MTRATIDLTRIVQAYDVRGLVGSELTPQVSAALGAAFADEVGGEGDAAERAEILVGHDMRASSPALAQAFCDGVRARGGGVVFLGLCSTDETYFASGSLQAPAAMFTASHNPADYNGIKFSRAGAQAISLDSGLAALRDRAQGYLDIGIPAPIAVGSYRELDVLADYAASLRGLVDLRGARPMRVVVDAGNGMAGLTAPAVLGTAAGLPRLPIDVVPLYFELDGTFPNHEANPLVPENLAHLQRAVIEHRADLGLAFDGDADRCFVVDEQGEPVTPSAVAALVALREIARVRSAQGDATGELHVLHSLITSRALPEAIERAGAIPVRTRVGHSLIKDAMRETGAVFAGEHSAHYYFRDFWGADNGMLAAMHVLAELGSGEEPLSRLSARFSPYAMSGEINSAVDDIPAVYHRIVTEYAGETLDELDGLTVSGATESAFWWFNVRPSNTEPLLRLNVEAGTAELMAAIRDRVLALIRA